MNKNFIYGIGRMLFNDTEVGYIEKDSFEYGGTKPDTVDVEAEQVPGAPVLTLVQKNGQLSPTFNLIQLNYENIQLMLGGELIEKNNSVTGWKAPTDLVEVTGDVKIETVSGQTIHFPNAAVEASFDGKLALSEVSKIAVQLKVNMPSEGAPYEIYDTDEDSEDTTA